MLNSIPSLLFENGGQTGKLMKLLENEALNRCLSAGSWRAVADKSAIHPPDFPGRGRFRRPKVRLITT
jgi:hypothetical protein